MPPPPSCHSPEDKRGDPEETPSPPVTIIFLGGHAHGELPLHHQAARSRSPCLQHSVTLRATNRRSSPYVNSDTFLNRAEAE